MSDRSSVELMWLAFGQLTGIGKEAEYSSWHFGDNEADANELIALVMAGKKRATASALWTYEHEGENIPSIGDYSVVTDGQGVAVCVVRTNRIEILPFIEVSPEFAATEGEGDGSLQYWRKIHWAYFCRELAGYGREPSESMPVVCEYFDVVYPSQ